MHQRIDSAAIRFDDSVKPRVDAAVESAVDADGLIAGRQTVEIDLHLAYVFAGLAELADSDNASVGISDLRLQSAVRSGVGPDQVVGMSADYDVDILRQFGELSVAGGHGRLITDMRHGHYGIHFVDMLQPPCRGIGSLDRIVVDHSVIIALGYHAFGI